MIYSVSFYIFEEHSRNDLYKGLCEIITDSCVFIRKTIQGGHHIELGFSNAQDRDKIVHFGKKKIIHFKKKPIDIEKENRIITKNSELESRHINLVKNQDHSIVISQNEHIINSHIDPEMDINIYETIQKYKVNLICNLTRDGYWDLDLNKQNLVAEGLFLGAALLHPNGIEFGYLSSKSNVLYFEEQLNTLVSESSPDLYKKWKTYVFDDDYLDEINLDIKLDGLKKKSGNQIKFAKDTYQLFLQNFHHIHEENISSPDSFFENSSYLKSIPEFHKKFFSNERLLKEFNKKEFVVYKYTMGSIYELMPLLLVSPLRKQKIMRSFVDFVETEKRISWRDIYDKISG